MASHKIRPTQEEVRSVFIYDKDEGILRWRFARNWRAKAGDIAGGLSPNDGHRSVKWGQYRTNMPVSCVIWLYVTGCWPPTEIDHKNTRPDDNRWNNLRLATRSQNTVNKAHKPNKYGYRGVAKQNGSGFTAAITIDRQRFCLGTFATPKEAAMAYDKAAIKLHGEFAWLNFPEASNA